jgi:hypothetical protein
MLSGNTEGGVTVLGIESDSDNVRRMTNNGGIWPLLSLREIQLVVDRCAAKLTEAKGETTFALATSSEYQLAASRALED